MSLFTRCLIHEFLSLSIACLDRNYFRVEF
uniref:Uncharacterized protein n=1 Tax=Rhizophora mucronata TaxID=61149 RepID=A0A2P2PAM7_RHIMU